MKSYKKLEEIFGKVRDLEDIVRLLEWDLAVLMPLKSLKYRSNQIQIIKDLIRNILVDGSLGDLINSAKSEDLNPVQKDRLSEMHVMHKSHISTPTCLAKDFSEICSECKVIWREAKGQNDYGKLLPYF